MKHYAKSILSGGLIVVIPGLGLILSLFILINPMQADQPGLKPSINVAATAQALQTRSQEARLETALRVQKATWTARVTEAQQNLTKFDDGTGRQLSQLQIQLDDFNSQIEQARLEIEAMQQHIGRLRQTFKIDQDNYQDELATLEAQLDQLERQDTANRPQPVNEDLDHDKSAPASTGDTDNEREYESDETNQAQDENDDHKSHTKHDDDEGNEDSD